ncbi:diaminopropionate ammonia-lyase [Pelosinus propionicus DSM 13327]|uniref:Diaminopropionate ammonia-lyase n=1 Tax=Pelosinus propionicus DSM 13327 TaxID=1123291 RepID=A0A1I4IBH2_9FIRM|nr:diaminopropionate ammonia-lyase [Pelosinus propionicus DSM 13327]
MLGKIKWVNNLMANNSECKASVRFLNKQEIYKANQFHMSFPGYEKTPLRSLSHLAQLLGVSGIYVKDESYRFGLNAFKVLGGSYAMARYMAEKLQKDISELPFGEITSQRIRAQLGDVTFATTTDGNHGRGVAWTARQLGQKSVVYMPKGSSPRRLENIRAEGAEAKITDYNYDDTVRMIAEESVEKGWIMVQDTAWQGYEDIPTWIMQGYGTMAAEALEQLNEIKIQQPTHIFIQAGVGSLAAAVQGYFASVFAASRPKTVVVEADQADCLYKSVKAGDGKARIVGGDMATIMAGLACGEPNTIGWNVLRDYSEMFMSCPDWVAAKGMRILANPLGSDWKVVSGESGAVTTGALVELMQSEQLKQAQTALGLNKDSIVLLFSTEGDTDPDQYRSIVWDGAYPSYK